MFKLLAVVGMVCIAIGCTRPSHLSRAQTRDTALPVCAPRTEAIKRATSPTAKKKTALTRRVPREATDENRAACRCSAGAGSGSKPGRASITTRNDHLKSGQLLLFGAAVIVGLVIALTFTVAS